ncbi:putative Serine/threonine-protein phosphatase 6 regulatory subunit 3-B [Blattamonas nauphoetae]|uniref:Serine/threonine-protein phosphatase 6 regulatory subunit 3-B n=1 Tax=Blattamonas nauphoetae TaxID=2049346 RepID=A0ABQ9XN66_9EUKA|nr:putative Serine/threonine-protein phosphatase 6 regulatory subunit 3-B [Blattamonas nauphoetae]
MEQWLSLLNPSSGELAKVLADNPTLERVFDCDELLDDFKTENSQLLALLKKPETVKEMLMFIVTDPPEDSSDERRYKYPYLVAEILSSEMDIFFDILLSPEVKDIIFSFLERDEPIQPLYSHHICRIIHSLIMQRTNDIVTTLKERQTIPKLIKHLNCFPFCEFLYDIVVSIEQTTSFDELVVWLRENDFMKLLLTEMKTSKQPLVPSNIAQILNNLIGRFTMPDAENLFTKIFLPAESELLVQIALDNTNQTAQAAALSILVDIVWNTRHQPQNEYLMPLDENIDPPPFVCDCVLSNMDKFAESLKAPNPGKGISNTQLKIIILYSTLIRSGYGYKIDEALLNHQLFKILVDLFFEHPHSSILHSEIYTIFEQGILMRGDDVRNAICVDSGLVEKVKQTLIHEKTRRDRLKAGANSKSAPARGGERPKDRHQDDSLPLLSHSLHLARIAQDAATTVADLSKWLDDEWNSLYEEIVTPEMINQESQGLPILNMMDPMGDQGMMDQDMYQDHSA